MRIRIAVALVALPMVSAQSQSRDTVSALGRASTRVDTPRRPANGAYVSDALRTLIAHCARNALSVPTSLIAYRAVVESEIALLLQIGRASCRERV